MIDKAKECCLKTANKKIAEGSYESAINYYAQADISLTTLPKETQEKLLKFVMEGNVEATQGLAKLVKSDEDEIIFNEARAGMVL
jgi:hypothetical protein